MLDEGESADPKIVTALALPRRATAPAVAPADAAAAVRRIVGTWSQPEPWIAAVVFATGVVVLARHPIAQALGTEIAGEPTPAVVATAPPAPAPVAAPSTAALAAAAVPTHAPRNPFHALVNSGGEVLAPDAAPVTAPVTHTRQHDSNQLFAPAENSGGDEKSGGDAGTCAGSMHRVVSGDSLWSIAARAVKSGDTEQVTVAWHRLYRVNRDELGSDPSMLAVGTRICVPNSL